MISWLLRFSSSVVLCPRYSRADLPMFYVKVVKMEPEQARKTLLCRTKAKQEVGLFAVTRLIHGCDILP